MSMPDDPERLADATPRSRVGELLASATRDVPSDAQLARLAANLGPMLDAPSPAATASKASLLVKLGIATGTLALLVGAGLSLRRSTPLEPTSPTAGPAVTTKAANELPAQPAPAPSPEPVAQPAPAIDGAPAAEPTGTSSAKSTSQPGKALSESALLEQARRALNGSPNYALQLANQHRTRFPHGVLSQEREVIAIEALRRMHRSGEADQRATGFSKAFPGSAHQRMVDEVAPK